MRKAAFITFIFLSLYFTNAKAQASIGSGEPPHDGAILEIVSNDIRGLLLPKVSLTSASAWQPIDGDETEGMIVYNINSATANGLKGKGVYVWYDNKWNILGKSKN